ncbi:MAG: hypothetical protein D6758_09275 [Gammaproteobacteria bacterium]|nr:MAG: hypothetical protein D6758_09275 [Gammaproteobacteria bacterium]
MLCLTGLILPVASLAADPCLIGTWQAASETAHPAGGAVPHAPEDSLSLTGNFTLTLTERLSDPANSAAAFQATWTYEDYTLLKSQQRGPAKAHQRITFNGETTGSWLFPGGENRITLTPENRIRSVGEMKLEIPGVEGMDNWRNMGEQPVDAPHRSQFDYVCRGDELVLKKEGATYSLGYDYVGHFRRR